MTREIAAHILDGRTLAEALEREGAVIVAREPDEAALQRAAAAAEKAGEPLAIWRVRAVWKALIGDPA